MEQEHFENVWQSLSEEVQEKVFAGGKGVIPYENIKIFDSLNSVSENRNSFAQSEFYTELKQDIVSEEEYENSKFLYTTLKMRNLSDMNDLYNFHNTCLSCKIIENQFEKIHKMRGYSRQKCNLASTLSGCIEREMSKVILSLSTNNEVVEVFERITTGRFDCISTRLAFDTEILMLNISRVEFDKMTIDESFQVFKRRGLKVEYKLKLDGEKTLYRQKSHIENFEV